MNDKELQFVADFRQWVRDYQQMMRRAWEINNRYGIYQNSLVEEDLPDGILPGGDPATKVNAITDAISNMQSVFGAFDAGIDDNFERVA